jgi:hypothetical protein
VFDKHFPFPTDVLMTSTNDVDGKHQWCWWQALMVLSIKKPPCNMLLGVNQLFIREETKYLLSRTIEWLNAGMLLNLQSR